MHVHMTNASNFSDEQKVPYMFPYNLSFQHKKVPYILQKIMLLYFLSVEIFFDNSVLHSSL